MDATAKYILAPPRNIKTAHKPLAPRSSVSDQLYGISLTTILHAHFYGHVGQASVLRTIALEIRRCLISPH